MNFFPLRSVLDEVLQYKRWSVFIHIHTWNFLRILVPCLPPLLGFTNTASGWVPGGGVIWKDIGAETLCGGKKNIHLTENLKLMASAFLNISSVAKIITNMYNVVLIL